VTDSSDPPRQKPPRRKSSREPATIDLKATVIDDGKVGPEPADGARDTTGEEARATEDASAETLQEARPDETIASASEPPAEAVVASPEATLDSGPGTDTLPSGAFVQDPAGQGMAAREAGMQDSLSAPPPEEPPAGESHTGSAPPPAAPERRNSAGALIGSGLLGGLVGAGLVYGLQSWQAPPAQDGQRLAQLEQRVNALRQQPAPAGQPQNASALEGRIQALESSRGEIDRRLQGIQSAAEQAARQAESALNRPLPEAAPAQAAPQNEAALADLSNRLSALEEQVRTNAQNAMGAANTLQEIDRRIADLDRRFGEQERRIGEVDRRSSEVERQLTENGRRLGEQDQRLAALSRQAAENTRNAAAASQTGTRVVLAGRLNDALQSGTPYAEVLDGIRKAGTDPARVAPLEPFAQEGAPTAAELAQSFGSVETAILRESRGPAESWTDRILRMADKVVTVRSVNEAGSTGVPALVARIRQALDRGDVAAAAAAWDSLPEPARRASEEWGRQVKAVAGAHQAAQGLSADALATLNRTTQ